MRKHAKKQKIDPWASGQDPLAGLNEGAALVEQALKHAGLNANGQDPAVAEIFKHYVDEKAPFPPKAAMFAQNDQARIERFPGGRTGLKESMGRELSGHMSSDRVRECVDSRMDFVRDQCATGTLRSGEHVEDPLECERIWRDGRNATTVQAIVNGAGTSLDGQQNSGTVGVKLSVPGFELSGAQTGTELRSHSNTQGWALATTDAQSALLGLRGECIEDENRRIKSAGHH